MGYRIELGEIEAAVSAIDKIRSCVCIYDSGPDKIILVYEGRIKRDLLAENIRNRIPAYMCPEEYIRVRQMPYNANGKIDRNYLKQHYKELS